ncbi:hypothetical protein ABTY20_21500 [Streptomyces sp. NPDC126497]
MNTTACYEAPALFEIGGFLQRTRWAGVGRLPDLIHASYAL